MRRKPTHMPTGRLKSLRLFSTLLAVTFFDKQRSFRPQAHGLGNLPAILACFEVDDQALGPFCNNAQRLKPSCAHIFGTAEPVPDTNRPWKYAAFTVQNAS